MSVAVITGSAGLVGSEASVLFAAQGWDIVGIDNDMRRVFFGEEASTAWNSERLKRTVGHAYRQENVDIRDRERLDTLFGRYGKTIRLVIHAAAQPSHDWAARDPFTDFDVNAGGTLNILEATRRHCPEAVFLFLSTNKVYGDTPNRLPLEERESRYELPSQHTYYAGIREDMSIDASLHSLFGASKIAADVLVQEYGRYFGMKTACFRCGTITGPQHAATKLHGFLGYVMRCAMTATPYTVIGYKGKQVRDAIHSHDLVRAFDAYFTNPRVGEVYNIGGGRFSHCSVLEAIRLAQEIVGRELPWLYDDRHRVGDHIWWVTDNGKFRAHYPHWRLTYDVDRIMREIYAFNQDRWKP